MAGQKVLPKALTLVLLLLLLDLEILDLISLSRAAQSVA